MTAAASAFGTLQTVRALTPDTVLVHAAFHVDTGQFLDPGAIAAAAEACGMSGRDDEEILAGEATIALAFLGATEARSVARPETVAEILLRFDDRVSFDLRVPGILGIVLPYMARLPDEIGQEQVGAVAMVERVSAAPGFDRHDILEAAIEQLSPMTAMSDLSILWIHSEMDRIGTGIMYREMARQAAFRRRARLPVTTFPRLGTIPATIAGLLPGKGVWSGNDGTVRLLTAHHLAPEDDLLPPEPEAT